MDLTACPVVIIWHRMSIEVGTSGYGNAFPAHGAAREWGGRTIEARTTEGVRVTGKERMKKAFSLEEPDAVPVWEMAFNEASIVKLGRFFTDDLPPLKSAHEMTVGEKLRLLEVLFTVVEELGLDGISSVLLFESEPAGDGYLKDSWGRVKRLSDAGEAVFVDGPVSRPEDLAGFSTPHPRESEYLMLMASGERFAERIAQVLLQPGPFVLSRSIVGGMQKYFPFFRTRPAFVHDLMRILTDYILESLDMACRLGVDIICLDGDLADNRATFMSPAHYDEFIFPYHREIVEHAHRNGKLIFKHSDGNMWQIMDRIVEAGFDGFHPVQPQCMDIGEVKDAYGERLCLLGNIDCAYLLPFGDEEAVEDAVRETIRVAAPGGGYVLASSNTMHPGCRAENYVAMVKAARRYGRYPIDVG